MIEDSAALDAILTALRRVAPALDDEAARAVALAALDPDGPWADSPPLEALAARLEYFGAEAEARALTGEPEPAAWPSPRWVDRDEVVSRPITASTLVDLTTLTSMDLAATTIAVGPDGDLAVATRDGVALFASGSLAFRRFLRNHTAWQVRWIAGGRLVVIDNGFARAFRCEDGAFLGELAVPYPAVAIAPTGDVALVGPPWRFVRVPGGALVVAAPLAGSEAYVAFSPDGARAAIGGPREPRVVLVDLRTGAAHPVDLATSVKALAFATASRLVVLDGSTVRALDAAATPPRELWCHAATDAHHLAAAGDWAAYESWDGWISVIGPGVATRVAHGLRASELAFLPDAHALIARDDRGRVHVLGVPAPTERPGLSELPARDGATRIFAWTPDLGTARPLFTSIAVAADGASLVVTGTESPAVRIDLAARTAAETGPGGRVIADPDGGFLLVDPRHPLRALAPDGATVDVLAVVEPAAVAVDAASARAFVAGRDGFLTVASTATRPWTVLARTRLSGHALASVAVRRGGDVVAVGGDGPLYLCSGDGAPITTLREHVDVITAVAFSPDGQLLASTGADHVVVLWDVALATVRARLLGHTDLVCDLAWGPDGAWLASVSGFHDRADGLRIWDPATGALRFAGAGHAGRGANAIACGPDGTIYTAGDDGAVLRWRPALAAAPVAPLLLAARPRRDVLGRSAGAVAVWASAQHFDPHRIGLPPWDHDHEQHALPPRRDQFRAAVAAAAVAAGLSDARAYFLLFDHALDAPVGPMPASPSVHYLGTIPISDETGVAD